MKVVSQEALTKLIQLSKDNFIDKNDTVQATTVQLATVATTGDYEDLTNKPEKIPSQSGQSGKYLTTNGSTVSWASVPSNLPSQSGQSGKYLTTNGTTASWSDLPEEIFVATYDSTTYSEISTAYNAGKMCYVDWQGIPVALSKLGPAQAKFLSLVNKYTVINITVTSEDVWSNNTLYFSIMTQDANKVLITDSTGESTTSSVTSTELGYLSGVTSSVQTQLNNKQPTLVSGTNIKTINNTSILGSGNLNVDTLPSQTGQSGKVLTTNGSTASWTNFPTVDQTYSGTSTNAQSGVAVKSAIDSAISSVYKPAGSVAFASKPALSSSIEGYVYNITDSFTTTSDFVEGAGKTYPAGTNIVCINTSGSTYKWDVLAGFVDLSGYQALIDSSHKLSADLVDDTSTTHKFVTASDKTTWSGKQDALVSGTNIKTINSTSLLGSGDISITGLPSQTSQSGKYLTTNGTTASWASIPEELPSQSGQSGKFLTTNGTAVSWANVVADSEIEWATYGTTTYQQVKDWYDAGKVVCVDYGSLIFTLSAVDTIYCKFCNNYELNFRTITVNTSSVWSSNFNLLGQSQIPAGTSGNIVTYSGTAGTVGSATINDIVPSQASQSGKFLTTNGSAVSWATVDALPSQTSQSGKFLTTNGTSASWADIPTEIPSQTGQSGKFLTTDGTDVSWATVSGGVYYGTCDTDAATQTKVVSCPNFTLTAGATINVLFSKSQSYNGIPKLNVNSTGDINIRLEGSHGATRYEWLAGEIIPFTYDGTYWKIVRGGHAGYSSYGSVILTDNFRTSSNYKAITPDATKAIVENLIEPNTILDYNSSSTYSVGTRVWYNNFVWECNTDITAAEEWTEAHWTKLQTLQEQIDSIQIDNNSITRNANSKIQTVGVINQANSSSAIKTWSGTLAQYNALGTHSNDCLYYITDDTSAGGGSSGDGDNRITKGVMDTPQPTQFEFDKTTHTLTIKAGTKVYYPDGKDGDNNLQVREYTIESDITYNPSTTSGTVTFIVYNITQNQLENIAVSSTRTTTDGTTDISPCIAYNSTTNYIKKTMDTGSTWDDQYSFPLMVVTISDGNIQCVKQVFQGATYIGKTAFFKSGYNVRIPNGIDSETKKPKYIDTQFALNRLITLSGNYSLFFELDSDNLETQYLAECNNVLVYEQEMMPDYRNTMIWYNPLTNYWYYTTDAGSTWEIVYLCFVTNICQLNTNYLSSFTPFGPDISLTTNDIRLVTHWCFPGKWRTSITPTSGSIYTAPGDGWFYISVNRTDGTSDAYASITGWETNYKVSSSCPSVDANSSSMAAVIMPVSSGNSVVIHFSGTVNECSFYYCNGSYVA